MFQHLLLQTPSPPPTAVKKAGFVFGNQRQILIQQLSSIVNCVRWLGSLTQITAPAAVALSLKIKQEKSAIN